MKAVDWTRWDSCPWCKARQGEPCIVIQSPYPAHNGDVSARAHHARKEWTLMRSPEG